MNYVERRPPASLSSHVECLWAVWDDDAVADRPPERIVPDGCPELIVHAGDVFERRDAAGRWKAQPRAFLVGTLTRPEAGYFDQSHLLRDFRELAGGAPRSLDFSGGELSRQLIRPERLRVLLADA